MISPKSTRFWRNPVYTRQLSQIRRMSTLDANPDFSIFDKNEVKVKILIRSLSEKMVTTKIAIESVIESQIYNKIQQMKALCRALSICPSSISIIFSKRVKNWRITNIATLILSKIWIISVLNSAKVAGLETCRWNMLLMLTLLRL